MRSGYFNVSGSALGNAGSRGYDWLSRSYSDTTRSYGLHFDVANVGPSNLSPRYFAFPLRCLSTVLGMGGEENRGSYLLLRKIVFCSAGFALRTRLGVQISASFDKEAKIATQA